MEISKEELKSIPLFASASEQTLAYLQSNIKVKIFDKGATVFSHKELLQNIYISLTGKFCLYKIGTNNDKRIIFIKDKGFLLNDTISTKKRSIIYCESFVKSKAIVIDKVKFIEAMKNDFDVTFAVVEQYSSTLRKSYRQLKNAVTTIPVEKKMIAKIYSLCRDFGIKTDQGVVIDMPITVTNLAEMIGAQRETVSRVLKKLTQEGLLVHSNKKILIHDLEAIVNFYNK